jgi:hypothetical protein
MPADILKANRHLIGSTVLPLVGVNFLIIRPSNSRWRTHRRSLAAIQCPRLAPHPQISHKQIAEPVSDGVCGRTGRTISDRSPIG